MEQLLSDASIIVRLEGGAALPLEPLMLEAVVRESLDALRGSPDAGAGRVQFAGACSRLVWGNSRAIRQIVTNLVSNAIKYNRDGGAVQVGIDERDGTIDLSVRDEGAGIPAEEQQKIFDKFYRCSATAGVKGAGLGLYVVRLLATGMGGSVKVASENTGGSIFTVTFRKADDAAPVLPLAAS